jgi:predicted HTH transcriptional regulator
MLSTERIKELIRLGESPIIEFKRQWYWLDDEPDCNKEKPKRWGELIKDIQGLTNAYYGYSGQTRYLIIGIDESSGQIQNVKF